MNKEEVRQKMLDIVGDMFNADSNKITIGMPHVFEGHTWQEAKDTINTAFDRLTVDHQKVKLPRDVGEELDTWIANKQDGYGGCIIDLCGSLWDEIQELSVTATFANKSEEKYFKVIDAYRYGWEADPEAKWYVQTPKEWWEDKNEPEYVELDSMGISDGLKCKEYAAQFTRAELKKYRLDSDIFTLVPVEEEK